MANVNAPGESHTSTTSTTNTSDTSPLIPRVPSLHLGADHDAGLNSVNGVSGAGATQLPRLFSTSQISTTANPLAVHLGKFWALEQQYKLTNKTRNKYSTANRELQKNFEHKKLDHAKKILRVAFLCYLLVDIVSLLLANVALREIYDSSALVALRVIFVVGIVWSGAMIVLSMFAHPTGHPRLTKLFIIGSYVYIVFQVWAYTAQYAFGREYLIASPVVVMQTMFFYTTIRIRLVWTITTCWLMSAGVVAITCIAMSDALGVSFIVLHILLYGFVNAIGTVSSIIIDRYVKTKYVLGETLRRDQTELERQKEKSDQLIKSILPDSIAESLKNELRSLRTFRQKIIADSFKNTSILFADIVGFTQMSAQMSPVKIVTFLNEIFSAFDYLVESFGLEKIRTIGDAYMAAEGLEQKLLGEDVRYHEEATGIAELALAMMEEVKAISKKLGTDLQIRIGINTGSCVAGIIGLSKFSYDLWGETVNLAALLESRGVPGKIQVSERTYSLLRDKYEFERREGELVIKGRKKIQTYFLVRRKQVATGDKDGSPTPDPQDEETQRRMSYERRRALSLKLLARQKSLGMEPKELLRTKSALRMLEIEAVRADAIRRARQVALQAAVQRKERRASAAPGESVDKMAAQLNARPVEESDSENDENDANKPEVIPNTSIVLSPAVGGESPTLSTTLHGHRRSQRRGTKSASQGVRFSAGLKDSDDALPGVIDNAVGSDGVTRKMSFTTGPSTTIGRLGTLGRPSSGQLRIPTGRLLTPSGSENTSAASSPGSVSPNMSPPDSANARRWLDRLSDCAESYSTAASEDFALVDNEQQQLWEAMTGLDEEFDRVESASLPNANPAETSSKREHAEGLKKAQNRFTLAFLKKSMEEEYREDNYRKNRRLVQLQSGTAFVFTVMLGLPLFFHEEYRTDTAAAAAAFTAWALLCFFQIVCFVLFFAEISVKRFHAVAVVQSVLLSAGFLTIASAMVAQSGRPGVGGMTFVDADTAVWMVAVFLWFFMGIPFMYTVLMVAVIAIALGTLIGAASATDSHLLLTLMAVVGVAVWSHPWGAMTKFTHERLSRSSFFLALRMDTERKKLKEEREKTEQLLLCIFPEKIALKLKQVELAVGAAGATLPAEKGSVGGGKGPSGAVTPSHAAASALQRAAQRNTLIIADIFYDVSVMFASIDDFTNVTSRLAPIKKVALLNKIFSKFDMLADLHKVEKIKTIGDAYMVVGGLPTPRHNHLQAIADMALDLQEAISHFKTDRGEPLKLRIGISVGEVVAGVIGVKKFSYDLWGDTVNTASRMESTAPPGGIQVTKRVWERLESRYTFHDRGMVNVKGKGELHTFLLTGKKPRENGALSIIVNNTET